jgi:ubiquinone/menaquinone biosynthesis C-methylase UbiE
MWLNNQKVDKSYSMLNFKRKFIEAFESGELLDLTDQEQVRAFTHCMDKYAEIISEFNGRKRVLDVGCAGGIMLSMLKILGHECYGVDFVDCRDKYPFAFENHQIEFSVCNIEVDALPFPDDYFDAVSCGQCLEHFTHSPKQAMSEFRRVLRPGGLVEIDLPNVACFRNRSRLLRGKNITWDFQSAYFDAEPINYRNMSFFPLRHNREYTLSELRILLERSNFSSIKTRFMKSKRLRRGFSSILSIGSGIRDIVPSFRKSIIGLGLK